MVSDAQVKKGMKLMQNGQTLGAAARSAKIDPRTLRKYHRGGELPSQMPPCRRTWRTRADPFVADDLTLVYAMLDDAPDLEASALFTWLCEQRPDRYSDGQLRTFQRRVETWRGKYGPEKEVWFSQVHRPGEAAQTDFMWINQLGVTIAGEAAPPMLSHTVLPFSNVEHATLCHSESMLAIRAGVQRAFFAWGHTPEWHQTDRSCAAAHRVGDATEFNDDYKSLMAHYGVKPRLIEVGACEQNGDVESANGALRRSLRQHLLLRGSSDFKDVEAFQAFIDGIIEKRNARRQPKFLQDLEAMTPITVAMAPTWKEIDARVSGGSTLHIRGNTYSVPSRLIGYLVLVRLYEGTMEVRYAGDLVLSVPRLVGKGQVLLDYRHVIFSFVRKPGAFHRYRHREHMYPTTVFRTAFDRLQEALGVSVKTDLEYLRILHLAATRSETDVESAIKLLIDDGRLPRLEDIRALVEPTKPPCPPLHIGAPDLNQYDRLLRSEA